MCTKMTRLLYFLLFAVFAFSCILQEAKCDAFKKYNEMLDACREVEGQLLTPDVQINVIDKIDNGTIEIPDFAKEDLKFELKCVHWYTKEKSDMEALVVALYMQYLAIHCDNIIYYMLQAINKQHLATGESSNTQEKSEKKEKKSHFLFGCIKPDKSPQKEREPDNYIEEILTEFGMLSQYLKAYINNISDETIYKAIKDYPTNIINNQPKTEDDDKKILSFEDNLSTLKTTEMDTNKFHKQMMKINEFFTLYLPTPYYPFYAPQVFSEESDTVESIKNSKLFGTETERTSKTVDKIIKVFIEKCDADGQQGKYLLSKSEMEA